MKHLQSYFKSIKKQRVTPVILLAIFLCMGLFALTGCTQSTAKAETEALPAVKSVKAFTASEEQYLVELSYRGYVTAEETKKLSFAANGKVAAVYVEQGQWVQAGDIVAQMDTSDVRMAISSAQLSLQKVADTYDANINSLRLNYEYLKDMTKKTAILCEAGAVSRQDYEDSLHSLNKLEGELNALQTARSNDVALQQTSISNYQKQLDDAVLIAPMDGYVSAVLVKAGEIASYGSPVIMLQAREQVVNIGISSNDYELIQTGMNVTMVANGQSFSGTVSRVALAPDESSRTYTVEIMPENSPLPLGTLVEVLIPVEAKTGVFIPISAIISSDGANYIYVLEEHELPGYLTAVKKEIVAVDNVYGEKVLVQNIVPGTRVILEGVKNIKEYDTVVVVE